MPNYDKLNVPQSLVYCQNANLAKMMLQKILDNAKAGVNQQAQSEFENIIQECQGIVRCADYWVFVVRFHVISREIDLALEALHKGFQAGAQPSNLLFTTQQSLNELQKKLEKQKTPKNLQNLPQISNEYFHQSQTLIGKPPTVHKWTDDEINRYQQEKLHKGKVDPVVVMTVPGQLGKLYK
ncbi:Conserved_hypothetical protein [Hexamita inflata]|uniref:Uncharacterized protein n=1 Tax=Hexamita inflata TaxID=28002 RepID=A0AA86P0V2_9EUKA|nr:Conserved hypothetical protein [Hexamita inflata]